MSGRRGERGTAAMELPLLIALVLIPLGLLVITVPTWIERQHAARVAASEAGRAIVTSASDDPFADADAVVAAVALGHGLPAGALELEVGSVLARGVPVTVEVTVEIPAVRLPGLSSLAPVRWTASHTERYPDLAELPS